VTIRKRRGGWQVIVYAGLDPLTGKQRQITCQVNVSRRQAEKVEARLRTEVADGQHAGTRIFLGRTEVLTSQWTSAVNVAVNENPVGR
jgi:hypothetical protein